MKNKTIKSEDSFALVIGLVDNFAKKAHVDLNLEKLEKEKIDDEIFDFMSIIASCAIKMVEKINDVEIEMLPPEGDLMIVLQ